VIKRIIPALIFLLAAPLLYAGNYEVLTGLGDDLMSKGSYSEAVK
jgi:hypothetical protein